MCKKWMRCWGFKGKTGYVSTSLMAVSWRSCFYWWIRLTQPQSFRGSFQPPATEPSRPFVTAWEHRTASSPSYSTPGESSLHYSSNASKTVAVVVSWQNGSTLPAARHKLSLVSNYGNGSAPGEAMTTSVMAVCSVAALQGQISLKHRRLDWA